MNKTEKFWDKLAKDIDPAADQLDQEQIQKIEMINNYLKDDDVVLDYGCARGGIALELANKVKSVHGIDLSSKMIDIAKKRAATRLSKHVTFAHAQIDTMTDQPRSFDVILALNVIHLVDDPDKVMVCINTLLKPGGLIIAETPCLGERKNLFSMIGGPLLYFIVKMGLLPRIHFFKMNALEELFLNAGFKIINATIVQESTATSYRLVAKKI